MNDSRLLLQEFHTLLTEYHEKLPMTKMYRDSLIRRVQAELEAPPTEVVPHMADAPPVSRERIVQGHSFFPPSAAFPKGYATGHRPYSQGWTDASGKSSEACYICTCLAEIDRLERELAARSPLAPVQEKP